MGRMTPLSVVRQNPEGLTKIVFAIFRRPQWDFSILDLEKKYTLYADVLKL